MEEALHRSTRLRGLLVARTLRRALELLTIAAGNPASAKRGFFACQGPRVANLGWTLSGATEVPECRLVVRGLAKSSSGVSTSWGSLSSRPNLHPSRGLWLEDRAHPTRASRARLSPARAGFHRCLTRVRPVFSKEWKKESGRRRRLVGEPRMQVREEGGRNRQTLCQQRYNNVFILGTEVDRACYGTPAAARQAIFSIRQQTPSLPGGMIGPAISALPLRCPETSAERPRAWSVPASMVQGSQPPLPPAC